MCSEILPGPSKPCVSGGVPILQTRKPRLKYLTTIFLKIKGALKGFWMVPKTVPSFKLLRLQHSLKFQSVLAILAIKISWKKSPWTSLLLLFSLSIMSNSLQPCRMDCGMPSLPVPHYLPNLWCHPTISSPVIPFSSCLQSFPASGSFPNSQVFTSGSQSIGASASASVLPVNIQGWFPLGLTGWISLLSKGRSRVFSSTTVQKHQFFGAQLSLWSNSHIHTWLLKKT